MDPCREMLEGMVDPVLIYQMGKVGSCSVYRSLKQAGIPNSIFHVHQLSDKGIERKENWLKHHNALSVPHRMEDLFYIKKLKESIAVNRSDLQLKIITLTRDPVGVELSAFFENIEVYGREVFNQKKEIDIEKTFDFLMNNIFAAYDVKKNYFCAWFDEELKTVFDIDAYAAPYDFSRGYSIIAKKNISVLVMRLEDLPRSFQPAIGEFLKIPHIELCAANSADNKSYRNEYRIILEKVARHMESFDLIYSSRYARHFYPPGAREKSLQKWASTAAMGGT